MSHSQLTSSRPLEPIHRFVSRQTFFFLKKKESNKPVVLLVKIPPKFLKCKFHLIISFLMVWFSEGKEIEAECYFVKVFPPFSVECLNSRPYSLPLYSVTYQLRWFFGPWVWRYVATWFIPEEIESSFKVTGFNSSRNELPNIWVYIPFSLSG